MPTTMGRKSRQPASSARDSETTLRFSLGDAVDTPNSNPTSDDCTSVRQLREQVAEFVAARDWHQFHAPKNLAMALAIEAAELMEHFQWLTVARSRELKHDPQRRAAVAEEMADVGCYLLALANELEVDLSQAIGQKMVKNAAKYPAEEYRGRYGPDDS